MTDDTEFTDSQKRALEEMAGILDEHRELFDRLGADLAETLPPPREDYPSFARIVLGKTEKKP